jgi:hypothetical protein
MDFVPGDFAANAQYVFDFFSSAIRIERNSNHVDVVSMESALNIKAPRWGCNLTLLRTPTKLVVNS